jgi:hypothetical protein
MNRNDILSAIFAVSALIDAELASLAKPSVVGKLYRPFDNSYATSLASGADAQISGVDCEIICEPYTKTIKSRWSDRESIHDMVKVRSLASGIEYEVLWSENCLLNENGVRYRDLDKEVTRGLW